MIFTSMAGCGPLFSAVTIAFPARAVKTGKKCAPQRGQLRGAGKGEMQN